MKRRRVFRGVLSMGYGQAVTILIQLAMVPALATAWGLPLYGQWLLLSAVPVFLAAGDFGFGTAAGNRLIGEVARGEIEKARITFESAFAIVLGCGAAVLALALGISALLPSRVLSVADGMGAESARTTLIVLCVFGVVATQSSLFKAVMRSQGAFASSATLESTIQLAEGLAVIAIALHGGTPLHAAFAYLAVRTFGTIGHIVFAMRCARWLSFGFRNVRRRTVAELLRPALAAMMLPLAQAGYLQGTALAVGAAAGAATVPIFTSLRTLSRAGLLFLMAIVKPILPEFTAEHARSNTPWLARIVGAMTTFNLLIGILAASILLFIGNSLLFWWTKGAIIAPQAMIALTAAGIIAGAFWNPMSLFLIAVNRHEGFTYTYAAVAAAAVATSYISVKHWGVTGAAGVNLLLDITMAACTYALLRRFTGPFPMGPSALQILIPNRLRRS